MTTTATTHKATKFNDGVSSGYIYRGIEIEKEEDGLAWQKFYVSSRINMWFRTLTDAKAAIDQKLDKLNK